MLSELILASVRSKKEPPRPYTGLSCSGLFPCAYRMYRVHTGKVWDEPTEIQLLNMADGWDQEEQAVRRLAQAGIEVKGRGRGERYLTVGRSNIPGSWDGYIDLEEPYTWDHKAMNNDSFWVLKNKGIEGFPGYKCQLNSYTLGAGFKKYIIQGKCKETNEPYDVVGNLDRDFIDPIIEWADRIRADGWIPEPVLSKYCVYCGINCFGTILDFKGINECSAPEMVERWRQAKKFQLMGKALEEEVRSYFLGFKDKLGNVIQKGIMDEKDEVLIVDSELKITKITQNRRDLSKELLLENYGAEAFLKCSIESHPIQYRFRDLGGNTISGEDNLS